MEYCQYSLYPCPREADMSSWDSGSSPERGSSDLCTATSGSCTERRVLCFVTPWYTAPPAPCHTSAYSTWQYSQQGHERIKQISVSFYVLLVGYIQYVARDLVSEVWVLGGHDLPVVVVELPDQRGVVSKRLWSGQLLGLVGPPVAACSSAQYTHTFTPLALRSACLSAIYVCSHVL